MKTYETHLDPLCASVHVLSVCGVYKLNITTTSIYVHVHACVHVNVHAFMLTLAWNNVLYKGVQCTFMLACIGSDNYSFLYVPSASDTLLIM